MTKIQVTPEQLDSVASQFANAHGTLYNQLNGLDSTMNYLHNQWDGMERNRFYNDYRTAKYTLSSVLNKVQSIEIELKSIASKFRNADGESTRGFWTALAAAMSASAALAGSGEAGDHGGEIAKQPKNIDEWEQADAVKYHQYEELLKNAEAIGDKQVMQKIHDQMNVLQLQYEDSVTRTDYNTGETSKITSDSLVAVTELTGKDGSKTDISIDKKGNVVSYEQNTDKYDYWVQKHTQSAGEHALGKTAQTVTGYGIGLILSRGAGVSGGGSGIGTGAASGWGEHVVGIGGGMLSDKVLFSVPDEGETRTMIYRTNKETGHIENMIIVTKGENEMEYRYWEDYN
ncbi:WXG100 family type VII secretion target [Paenibacillus sp. 1182]|uniref:WXG100 family type VII secretion target n=1 Tax=unclassified Paenibacillus TaxID=185978 RepID=UPI000FAA821B|nr:WXG100 family type VII secretion target [Paenibacillus sp. 1182]MBP1311684.1 WXG100 family type VII secretion target [Paenibacillus sp. 1182]